MKHPASIKHDSFDDTLVDAEGLEETSEDDLLSRLAPDFN